MKSNGERLLSPEPLVGGHFERNEVEYVLSMLVSL